MFPPPRYTVRRMLGISAECFVLAASLSAVPEQNLPATVAPDTGTLLPPTPQKAPAAAAAAALPRLLPTLSYCSTVRLLTMYPLTLMFKY